MRRAAPLTVNDEARCKLVEIGLVSCNRRRPRGDQVRTQDAAHVCARWSEGSTEANGEAVLCRAEKVEARFRFKTRGIDSENGSKCERASASPLRRERRHVDPKETALEERLYCEKASGGGRMRQASGLEALNELPAVFSQHTDLLRPAMKLIEETCRQQDEEEAPSGMDAMPECVETGTIPGQMKEDLKHARATPRPVARNHGMIRLQGKQDELAHSRNKAEQNVNAEYVSSEVTDGFEVPSSHEPIEALLGESLACAGHAPSDGLLQSSKCLFLPLLPQACCLAVETINADTYSDRADDPDLEGSSP